MTAKEKANELVYRFMNTPIMCDTRDRDDDDAIKCALICVDEILKFELLNIKIVGNSFANVNWQEVKQEIEKL